MNKLGILALSGVSALLGGAAGWKLCRLRYEQRVREEIESVKRAFAQNATEARTEETEAPAEPEGNLISWATEHRDRPYVNYAKVPEAEEPAKETFAEPYLISEDAFGEREDYDNQTLLWYGGDMLQDTDGERVSVEMVGREALALLSQEGEEVVYVRNEELETDFEIVRETDGFDEE